MSTTSSDRSTEKKEGPFSNPYSHLNKRPVGRLLRLPFRHGPGELAPDALDTPLMQPSGLTRVGGHASTDASTPWG